MSGAAITAIIVAYLLGALLGWRIGYVRGYEAAARRWSLLGHDSHREGAIFAGAFSALFWPLAILGHLFLKYATPTPPTVAAKERAEALRRIAQLEREAGIR